MEFSRLLFDFWTKKYIFFLYCEDQNNYSGGRSQNSNQYQYRSSGTNSNYNSQSNYNANQNQYRYVSNNNQQQQPPVQTNKFAQLVSKSNQPSAPIDQDHITNSQEFL